MTDGKQLEALVAFVEKALLPQGFEVKINERVFNEDGVQIAEFDVEVRGKIGSTTIAWLIECRDRPGSGPAPASWIEQLVGRRVRFGFNKVSAVSTTGFAPGAIEFAKEAGIELREVNAVTPEEFDWILSADIRFIRRVAALSYAKLLIDEKNEGQERRDALSRIVASVRPDTQFLKSITTGQSVSAPMAFSIAVQGTGNAFSGLNENEGTHRVQLLAKYPDHDHFVVETEMGPVRIDAINFEGELRVERIAVPLASAKQYEHSGGQGVISQIAAFEPVQIADRQFSLEFHRMGEHGETHMLLREVE